MLIKEKEITLDGERVILVYFEYEPKDKKIWKKLFVSWKITDSLLRSFWARWANLPEWISEVAFCMATWAVRFKELKTWWKKVHASFDTYDLQNSRTQQIKASSVEFDLSSFWPRSERDDLYFLDFYNNWKLDWCFDIYSIPTDYIYWTNINSTQSFQDQQREWRRPRLSLKKNIIIPHRITPIAKDITISKPFWFLEKFFERFKR